MPKTISRASTIRRKGISRNSASRDNKVFNLELDLTGNYQVHNILTAIAVIDLLHQETPLTISLRALTEGMRTVASGTALQGRWQKLGDKPLTICDTGHNAHGIRYVAEQLAATPHRDLYCVLGFVNDKDLSSVLPLFPKEARYIFTQPGNERALPAGKLAEKAAAYGLRGEVADTVSGALARAREMASEEDMIFIGGSNFVVAEVLE